MYYISYYKIENKLDEYKYDQFVETIYKESYKEYRYINLTYKLGSNRINKKLGNIFFDYIGETLDHQFALNVNH